MLNFLKPKNVKVAEATAHLFRPTLDAVKSVHNGALPASVLKDDILLGYMAGALAVATNAAGIVNPKINGLAYLHFFERLFPGHGMTFCKQHPEKLSNSETYLEAYKEGVKDYSGIEDDRTEPEFLKKHIEQTYPHEI